MKYIHVPGLEYSGETMEEADARDRAMIEHNRRMDELAEDYKRQRREPMPAMREWAAKRGFVRNVGVL